MEEPVDTVCTEEGGEDTPEDTPEDSPPPPQDKAHGDRKREKLVPPPGMSKNQMKKMLKRQKWMEEKTERR